MYNDKTRKMSFKEYTTLFIEILDSRNCIVVLQGKDLDKICYLCSEDKADKCHRRLVAEAIKGNRENIKIIHL